MTFKSILFDQDIFQLEELEQPDYFVDLFLDQAVDSIINTKKDYNLKPYFYFPLQNINVIKYRMEIFKDLENQELFNSLENFSKEFSNVRGGLNSLKYLLNPLNKMGWHLEIALTYCMALNSLCECLEKIQLKSRGLTEFKNYLFDYINSIEFKLLCSESSKVKDELKTVHYSINIESGSITVQKYKGEKDYNVEVSKLFERFREKDENKIVQYENNNNGTSHIGSVILNYVAQLFPEQFSTLKDFFDQIPNFVENNIIRFDREIQFYIGYLQFIAKIKNKGLNFCYPEITTTKQEIYDYNAFDIALALRLLSNNNPVVLNDFSLKEPERIIIVSGPNQGGKTTFARMFGQLHYLARLGVPIPGTKAKIFISDHIFTHFEREESVNTLQGKLLEELTRIKSIYSKLTPNSIFIINEIFNSTTLEDAIFLGTQIMNKLLEIGVLCVVVSFIDELSNLGPSFVSMVSNIIPDHPETRTFEITRKPADGLAYALAIAKKHKLTFSQIKERMSF